MLIIGLTGGIGSGKSTVAQRFAELGIPVIDADITTRKLVVPGQPALEEIAQQFGTDILLPSGELDRAQLRQRVFSQPNARKRLEAILHPRARAAVQQRIVALQNSSPPPAYCILCVPLLIESGWQDLVQRILVVDTEREQQIQRTQQRDQLSRQQVNAIIDSQADRDTRLAAADDVITNTGDRSELQAQIDALHQRYLQLAGAS
jgi:dephospho-CoA kinase